MSLSVKYAILHTASWFAGGLVVHEQVGSDSDGIRVTEHEERQTARKTAAAARSDDLMRSNPLGRVTIHGRRESLFIGIAADQRHEILQRVTAEVAAISEPH